MLSALIAVNRLGAVLRGVGHVYVATTDDLGDHAGEDVSEQ